MQRAGGHVDSARLLHDLPRLRDKLTRPDQPPREDLGVNH
jgi:hypothetical protein